jgi:hypothetical protein
MKNLLGEIFSKVPLRLVLVVPFLLQIFIAIDPNNLH